MGAKAVDWVVSRAREIPKFLVALRAGILQILVARIEIE